MLERVVRPDAEPVRVRERPKPPLPPSFLTAGNAAVTRAILARNRKQWERDASSRGLQNAKEKELYIELRQNKFADDDIDVAGASTPNADLLAYDGKRMWIVEVKGHTDWLSRDNQERHGNVPLKQIANKLKGKLSKEIQVSKVEMTIEDALADPSTAGRRSINLAVTNLDTQGALLAVQMITNEETGDREATMYATTINEVIRFFDDVLERYDGSSEDAAQAVTANSVTARTLLTTWRKGCDPDEFLQQHGPDLERIYTLFRKVMTQDRQQFATFKKLDADLDVNVALLPVSKSLARVARHPVLARTRFKGVDDASGWLERAREQHPREEEEDDDSWITRLLLADEEYGGNDFTPNYQMLVKALGQPVQPPVQQRQAPRGTKKRTIEAKMWNHIVNGVVEIEKVGSKKTPTEKVTGLHTIHGDNPAAEGFGPKTMVGTHGCYKQSVRAKRKEGAQSTAEERDKKFQSTFYPDDWDLEDIREAIEYSSQRGKEYEVLSPAKGIGLVLFFNGESYYPNYR